MKLNLIVESKNFDGYQMMKKQLDKDPCHLCLLGQGMMCVERKYCRWESHREIYIKSEVCEINDE